MYVDKREPKRDGMTNICVRECVCMYVGFSSALAIIYSVVGVVFAYANAIYTKRTDQLKQLAECKYIGKRMRMRERTETAET